MCDDTFDRFNTLNRSIGDENSRALEKHTEVLARLDKAEVAGADIQVIIDAFNDADSDCARARIKTAVKRSKNPLLNTLSKNYNPGKFNNGNVISLDGPAGFGKTFAIDLLGRDYEVYIQHGCSEDCEEIGTLSGGPVADADSAGGFVSIDGKLAQAFRCAAAGKKTLMFFDEHYRLSPRTQEWLLTTLQPKQTASGNMVWVMTTKKAVNGNLEEIEASCDLLHIVVAGNLERRRPVAPYWDRFDHERIDFCKKKMKEVAEAIAEQFGIAPTLAGGDLGSLTNTFAEMVGDSRSQVALNTIVYPLSPRDFVRACAKSDGTEKGVAKVLIKCAPDKCQSWDCDTGDRMDPKDVFKTWTKWLTDRCINIAGATN